MKFIVTRSQRMEESLRFFRSIRIWRDAGSEELVVLWRPGRFLALFGGMLAGLPAAVMVAATLWIQASAPGVPIGFTDVAFPWRWGAAIETWKDFQNRTAATARAPDPDQPEQPAAPTPSAVGEPAESLAGLDPVLKDFLDKNGTQRKLQGIKSVTVRGVVTLATGQQLDFTMVKKFPGQMRLTITDRASTVQLTKLSRDGQGWQWLGDPFANGVRRLGPDDAGALAREVWHSSAALEIAHRLAAVEAVDPPPAAAAGRRTLRAALPGGMHAEAYLNAETARPEQVRINFLLHTEPSIYDVLVTEWQTIEGVPEPAAFEVLVNEQKLLACRLTQITYNTGAYDVLFTPPAGAPQVDGTTEGLVPASQIGGAAPVLPALTQPSSVLPKDSPPVVP